jgi:drug/metabolite transporter (DMT)-like permease
MQILFNTSIGLIGADSTAYLSWGIASVFWVVGFMYVSEHGIDSYSSNLSRGVMLFLFNLPVILHDKTWLSPDSIKNMTIRHVLLVLYSFIFAQCFFYLPINVVHTLYSSGPIFVLAIDYVINKIVITRRQMVGAAIAFGGVLLTVNGHILYQLFGENELGKSEFKHYRPEAAYISVQLLVSAVLLLATVGWAYSIVIVKKIKNSTHYHLNFQYGYLIIMASGCLYQNTEVASELKLEAFLWSLLYQGLPLAIGQTFFSNAVKLTKNHGITTMVGFIGVILGYLVKVFRYKEELNLVCLFGSAMIMFGVFKIAIK